MLCTKHFDKADKYQKLFNEKKKNVGSSQLKSFATLAVQKLYTYSKWFNWAQEYLFSSLYYVIVQARMVLAERLVLSLSSVIGLFWSIFC